MAPTLDGAEDDFPVGSIPALYISQLILRGQFPFTPFFLLPLTPAVLFLILSFLERKQAADVEA